MKYKRTKGLFLLSIALSGILLETSVVNANFEGFQNRCETSISSTSDSSDSGSSTTGSVGSWETEGTEANKIAQNMWNYWKNKGFGGSAIAGVLGNVAHEGGFDITDRAEGHFGNTSKDSGLSEGVVPSVGAGYPVGKTGQVEGGGGHYQFTPYSKFAPVGDANWKSTEKQSDYVWDSEVKNASWLKDYISIDSVDKAVEVWFSKYERGASLNPTKVDSGKKAYQIFGGANVKGDSALASATQTATKGEEESKKSSDDCSDSEQDTSKSNASSSEIIGNAKELLGYFKYVQVHGEANIGTIDKPKKDGVTDCSGFVWLILARTGYSVPSNMGWFTGTMESDAKGSHQWLEEVKPSEAKAGDIVIVNTGNGAGSNGHTAILTEDWKASKSDAENTTKIIQMGGSLVDGVNESSFNNSFSLLVDGTSGAHTTTLARPIKK